MAETETTDLKTLALDAWHGGYGLRAPLALHDEYWINQIVAGKCVLTHKPA